MVLPRPGRRRPAAVPDRLVAAIQISTPSLGREAAALLEAGADAPADAVLVSLINDLDLRRAHGGRARRLPRIDGAAVHEAVTFLLDNLPPQVTLAMTTRADPPLPLSRLRARGELVEVRAADLQVHRRRGGGVPQRGDGAASWSPRSWPRSRRAPRGGRPGCSWPRCRLRTRRGRRRGAGRSPGSSRRSPEAIGSSSTTSSRRCWTGSRTRSARSCSTPPCSTQLTGRLCDALTGRSDGQAMLEDLDRENLFVVPLDDERRWYRYHHLFADALRARLAPSGTERVGGLHAAASVVRRERAARRRRAARHRERRPRARRRPRRARPRRPAPATPGPHPPRLAGRAARRRRAPPAAARHLHGVEPALRGR